MGVYHDGGDLGVLARGVSPITSFRSWRDCPGKETQASSSWDQTLETSGREELPKSEKDKTCSFFRVFMTADQSLGTMATIY